MMYNYTKQPVDNDKLSLEIMQSAIVTALDYISILGDQVDIYFKAYLTTNDKNILDTIVANHDGIPNEPENIVQKVELASPTDEFEIPKFRRIVTKPTWLYAPHSIDFTASQYGSMYNRKHDGFTVEDSPDVGDAWMKFYKANGDELVKGAEETPQEFQARLDADCTKTTVEFEKTNSFDIQAAALYIENCPVNRAYLWCIFAPDIPSEYGGSKVFMGRGMNLRMMAAKHPHIFDAVSANTVYYDPVNHSGKLLIVVKHAPGEQIGLQIVFFCFEE